MTNFIYEVLTAYVCAVVVGASSLFEPFRYSFTKITPWLKIGEHKHFIECRLCLSFWLSILAVYFFSQDFYHVLPCYGASYWLCTQER